MIKLENVSKAYSAGIPALNDVSLHIETGEFVFVVGDSGSGKSTLIKLLLKELEPTGGSITINGQRLGNIRHKDVPKFRRNLGVVFQDFQPRLFRVGEHKTCRFIRVKLNGADCIVDQIPIDRQQLLYLIRTRFQIGQVNFAVDICRVFLGERATHLRY